MEEGEARNIAIVHYNTPELTTATVKSIFKHSPGCSITVFDNSDRRPFPQLDGVRIIDNTKGQLVDFDKMLDKYPDKIPTACNWGSEKHIASVDYLFDVLPGGFLLMDSDILLRKDISSFFDDSVAWVGTVERIPRFRFQAQRLYPFLLWINVPMCKENGVRFFHEGMVYKMSYTGRPYYDTGGSFYKDCLDAGLPSREVYIFDYMEHLGGASCGNGNDTEKIWLEIFRALYE